MLSFVVFHHLFSLQFDILFYNYILLKHDVVHLSTEVCFIIPPSPFQPFLPTLDKVVYKSQIPKEKEEVTFLGFN